MSYTVRIDKRGYVEVYKNYENLAQWDKPGPWTDAVMGETQAIATVGAGGRFRFTFASAKKGMLLDGFVVREGDKCRQVRSPLRMFF